MKKNPDPFSIKLLKTFLSLNKKSLEPVLLLEPMSVILFLGNVFKCLKQLKDLTAEAVETGIISRTLIIF